MVVHSNDWIAVFIMLIVGWLSFIWVVQPLGRASVSPLSLPSNVVFQIVTSSEHLIQDTKPIMAREKYFTVEPQRPSSRSNVVVGNFEQSTDLFWAKDARIWHQPLSLYLTQLPQVIVQSAFPIKDIAVSTDRRYVAYTVRRFSAPIVLNYIDPECVEQLGDTVFLKDLQTNEERMVYTVAKTAPGVGNLHFLPDRNALIFNDDRVFQFEILTDHLKELSGFAAEESPIDVSGRECTVVNFFALSPHGRYGIAHIDTLISAMIDAIYDFQEDKMLGRFIYSDDFGAETVIGFVAEDKLLVHDDSYRNFQYSTDPQLAIFDVRGNKVLTIVTTSRTSLILPEVFVTSSQGWHIASHQGYDTTVPYIFDPFTFKIVTSSVGVPPLGHSIKWEGEDYTTSSRLISSYGNIVIDDETIDVGPIVHPIAR